jgi:hypothetical protein
VCNLRRKIQKIRLDFYIKGGDGMSRKIDLTGMRFGKLLVIAEAKERASQREVQWICLCDCGKETIVRSSRLRKGLTQSCGCTSRD